jgi:hypothetical protein
VWGSLAVTLDKTPWIGYCCYNNVVVTTRYAGQLEKSTQNQLTDLNREYATLPIRVAPLDESPGFIIHCLDTRLSAGLSREFQNAGYDVTPEQWAVLNRLWQEEGIHQAELAQRTSKDRHNITRICKLDGKKRIYYSQAR